MAYFKLTEQIPTYSNFNEKDFRPNTFNYTRPPVHKGNNLKLPTRGLFPKIYNPIYDARPQNFNKSSPLPRKYTEISEVEKQNQKYVKNFETASDIQKILENFIIEIPKRDADGHILKDLI